MPNHVHIVFAPLLEPVRRRVSSPYLATDIVGNLQWHNALKADRLINRKGLFWRHESYDHIVRVGDEVRRILQDVACNPVNSGLCKDWRDWKWIFVKEAFF
ncbi:MAG: hypothetical protein FJ215_00165 [Ignavibacteria bacterium]|nr:hypothetical protein [Ignavibacteria bacterium]